MSWLSDIIHNYYFLKKGGTYLSETLYPIGKKLKDGLMTFSTWFFYKIGLFSFQKIVLVSKAEIANQIAKNIDSNGSNTRIHFKIFNSMLNKKANEPNTLLAETGATAICLRSNIKQILESKTLTITNNLQKAILTFAQTSQQKPTHLHQCLYKMITIEFAQQLLGLHDLPDDTDETYSLSRLLTLIDEQDRAVTCMDLKTLFKANPEIAHYSKLLFEKNKDTLLSRENLAIHIVPGLNEESYVARILILSANITNLIIFASLKMMSDLDTQDRFRAVLTEMQPNELISLEALDFYKEFLRLYAGPPITGRTIPSNKTIPSTNNETKSFELIEKSYVIFPIRMMRLEKEFGTNPLEFDETRHSDPSVPNIFQPAYNPFGYGIRKCPASDQFVPALFFAAMRTMFVDFKWHLVEHQKMENIPFDAHLVRLIQDYKVMSTPVNIEKISQPRL